MNTTEMVGKIRNLLQNNPAAVERAILVLYDRQTSDEQANGETRHDNKIGFNAADAKRMSFVARFLKNGGHLTRAKALNVYGPRLQKYAVQLAGIAMEKAKNKS